jgi:fluoride exporter
MREVLLVALGGAVGSVARYGVTLFAQSRYGAEFPYGTLAVNVTGSLLLGVIMALADRTDLMPPTLRLALGTGVMGGFTTYSAFNYETYKLAANDALLSAIVNVLVTLVLCTLAGLVGVFGVRAAFSR